MMRSTVVLVLASSLAGCATYGPVWSEVSGNRYHRAVLNRQPALIEKVDKSKVRVTVRPREDAVGR